MKVNLNKAGKRYGLIEQLESRRLLSGGSLDTSFNSPHGVDSVTLGSNHVTAYGTGVQPNGDIVEVGGTSNGQYALIRLNTKGVLDSSFGTGGSVIGQIEKSKPSDVLNAVAIQSDGKIVAVGQGGNDGDDMLIMRFLSNGTLDKSFAGDGVQMLQHFISTTGSDTWGAAIAIQNDGKILVAGHELEGLFGVNDNLVMARLNTNGLLDTSFGTDGETNLDLGKDEDATALAIDYNGTASTNSDYGRIVVVGHQTTDWDYDIRLLGGSFLNDTYKIVIARYNSNGKLDTSFAGDGHEVTTAGSSAKSVDAEAVTIESGGKIVIAGNQGTNVGSTDHDFFLARFNFDGSLDKTFGSSGHTTTNFGGDDYATSLVIGAFGQQLIAGGTSSGKFALAAYSLDGQAFAGFGTGGVVTTKGDNKVSHVQISLSPTDKIVAAGGTNFNTARYLDITPDVSITATDATAGPTTFKRVGKLFEPVPNNASMIVARDERLDVDTKVYFTVGGTATPPSLFADERKIENYTLSGMSVLPGTLGRTIYSVDIPAGQTFVTVTLTPQNIPANTQTASFAIQAEAYYTTSTPASQTITILGTNPVKTTTLVDTADAYVQDGTSAGTNFGSANPLLVKKSGTSGDTRQAYFKFNLSGITSVNNVTLSLFGELNNTSNTNLESDLYSVADTTWTETGITNNNKPAAGTELGSIIVANTTAQTYTIDVTQYVKAQIAAGHTTISFVLKNPSNSGSAFLINSREASSNQPTLTIT